MNKKYESIILKQGLNPFEFKILSKSWECLKLLQLKTNKIINIRY